MKKQKASASRTSVPPGKQRMSKKAKDAMTRRAAVGECSSEEKEDVATTEAENDIEEPTHPFVDISQPDETNQSVSDIEKTIRIVQKHEKAYAEAQASRTSSSSEAPAQHSDLSFKETRYDPHLLFYLLGNQTIREILLFYLEFKELKALSCACKALRYIVKREYVANLDRRDLWHYEGFEFFARGCWELPDSGIAFADRTSVAFHMMNEMTKIKYSLFSGQHFVALPRDYLEDLVKMCWTIYNIFCRNAKHHHWVYPTVIRAFTDAIDSHTMILDGTVHYLIGDRYAFSHEKTVPFVFDWRVPTRCFDLKYFEHVKAETAMSVLCGKSVNRLDSTTNRRLKLYDARTAQIRLQMENRTLAIPMFQFSGTSSVQKYFQNWKFSTARATPQSASFESNSVTLPPYSEKVAIPTEDKRSESQTDNQQEKAKEGGCVIV